MTGVFFAALALQTMIGADPDRAPAEAAAIAAVRKLGGQIECDEGRPGRPVIGVRLEETAITAADLRRLGEFKDLRILDLSYTGITDAGLAQIQGLTRLETLDLEGTGIGDAGLMHLQGLGGLRYLSMSGTQVSNAGLASLRRLARLRELEVGSTGVNDEGAASLRQALPNVEIFLDGVP